MKTVPKAPSPRTEWTGVDRGMDRGVGALLCLISALTTVIIGTLIYKWLSAESLNPFVSL